MRLLAKEVAVEIFVARQPIFDRHLNVYGYELLFRQGLDHVLSTLNNDSATSTVVTNSFSVIGLDILTSGKRAFINFTRNLLLQQVATALPAGLLAVEVLETVEPDEPTVEACRLLKQRGYMLVLDDYIDQPAYAPLVALADIIKIDFLTTSLPERRRIPQMFGNGQIRFLAEKVETQEDFQMALDFGYTLVQGYFFSKPETIAAQDIPGYKLNYLFTLYEINQPDVDFDAIERVIMREVSLSYKLLRFVNSAYFNLRHRIKTIRHALTLLGIQEIRKWASLVALSGMGEDKPDELAVLCALRGKFCELIGINSGFREDRTDIYLMGLFSLVDALMDSPLDDILTRLPLHEDVNRALKAQGGRFEPIYRLALAYEEADWQAVTHWATMLQLPDASIPGLYQEAVNWTNGIFYNEDSAFR